jgi:hypothetical protein
VGGEVRSLCGMGQGGDYSEGLGDVSKAGCWAGGSVRGISPSLLRNTLQIET